jgi:phage gp36-like protein
MEPQIGSLTDITSADLAQFMVDAEAEVNAMIARQYTTPVSGSALLEAAATDISIYRLYSRRVFPGQKLKDSDWPDRYKEARDVLKMVAAGEMILVDSAGKIITARTDVAEVFSSTEDYQPTFTELGAVRDRIDPDKLEDLADERDLRTFGDLID